MVDACRDECHHLDFFPALMVRVPCGEPDEFEFEDTA